MQPIDFRDVKVLIAGHIGFKGTWLSRILNTCGAQISGLSLRPERNSLSLRACGNKFKNSKYIDINNRKKTAKFLKKCNPNILIHRAAQPLVRRLYREPVEAYVTNVMGTAHVLDVSLSCSNLKGIVAIATDKVYRNIEKLDGYHEDEPLGGEDPYSASKSGSEMFVSVWHNLSEIESDPKIVAASSGYVIGGGDHAANRLLPELIRGFLRDTQVEIRNPNSLRPWQHFLDPLLGYLSIASNLLGQKESSDAFNFGPDERSKLKVSEMADFACGYRPENKSWKYVPSGEDMPESNLIWLSLERSQREIGWRNKLDAKEAIKWTISWKLMARDKGSLAVFDKQIESYSKL